MIAWVLGNFKLSLLPCSQYSVNKHKLSCNKDRTQAWKTQNKVPPTRKRECLMSWLSDTVIPNVFWYNCKNCLYIHSLRCTERLQVIIIFPVIHPSLDSSIVSLFLILDDWEPGTQSPMTSTNRHCCQCLPISLWVSCVDQLQRPNYGKKAYMSAWLV